MGASRSYRVRWAEVARCDLIEIFEFIASDDPLAAAGVLRRFATRARSLERMPERGRVVPELKAVGVQSFRELVVTPWRVICRISGDTVFVLAVLDGRRNLEDVLLDRLVR